MKSSAEARLEVAKAKSEALQKEAATESENSENIQPMRSHEARMEMSDVLEKMAKDGKFVVSGKTGSKSSTHSPVLSKQSTPISMTRKMMNDIVLKNII